MIGEAQPSLSSLLRRELSVDHARWIRMLGMTACASLVTVVLLVFRVPLAAYSPYVVLMAAQRDLVSSIILSISAMVSIAAGIMLSFILYLVDIDEPALRIPLMALVTFAAVYLSRAPKVGPIFFLTGYILVITQTLADQVGDPEALTYLLLWLAVVAFSACMTMALVEAMAGRKPSTVFAEGIQEQLTPSVIPTASAREMALEASRLGASALVKLAAVLQLKQVATIRDGTDNDLLDKAVHTLNDTLRVSSTRTSIPLPPSASGNMHLPGVRFAFKTTLAAMICYIAYSALDWPGIRTAVITCFFVAMASTGETIHKLNLRMIGASIGGLLACLSIVFVFPWLDDIGGFIVVFAAVTLFCAWVTTANQLIAYAGQQITLAFYLGMLQDTGPTDDLTVLRDRLVGVFLGNVVMSVMFATVWPVSTLASARAILARVLRRQANLLEQGCPPAPADVVATATDMEDAARLSALANFDVGPGATRCRHDAGLLPDVERAVAWSNAWLQSSSGAVALPRPACRLRDIASQLERAPRGDKVSPRDGADRDAPAGLSRAIDALARGATRAD